MGQAEGGSRHVAPSAVPASIGNPPGFDLFPKPPRNRWLQVQPSYRRPWRKLRHPPQACLASILARASLDGAYALLSGVRISRDERRRLRHGVSRCCCSYCLERWTGRLGLPGLVTLIGSIVRADVRTRRHPASIGSGHGDRPSYFRQPWDSALRRPERYAQF
jgi:hypothetical protein